MTFAFPRDLEAARCDDQYMFGDSILVAAVVAQGATSKL
jgi:alpha-glucosidase (family GH31 glycosyl hydrolase)